MTDFEENWKNSEVISIFAQSLVADKEADIGQTPTNEYISEVKVEKDPIIEFTGYIRAQAALETYSIVNDLKKLAQEAIVNKNYKAALLIESAIEDLENRIDD